jgi:hypothetical protein
MGALVALVDRKGKLEGAAAEKALVSAGRPWTASDKQQAQRELP